MVEDAVGVVAGGRISVAGVVAGVMAGGLTAAKARRRSRHRRQASGVQRLPALLRKRRGDRGEHAQQGRDGVVPDGWRDVVDCGGQGSEGVSEFDEV